MLFVVLGFKNLNGQSEISYGPEDIHADAVKCRTRFLGIAAVFRGPFGALFAYTAIA